VVVDEYIDNTLILKLEEFSQNPRVNNKLNRQIKRRTETSSGPDVSSMPARRDDLSSSGAIGCS